MRKLMLKRIDEIRQHENNFSRDLMKWKTPLSISGDNNDIVLYADGIEYEFLTDDRLLFFFEKIIKRYNTQM